MEHYTEREKQKWLYGCRMVISVSVVYPRDGPADWELWLAAVAEQHNRVPLCTSLEEIQHLKSGSY